MCVAIYSKMGNKLPSKKYLENCFDGNPDGSGFAFNHDGVVTVKKGYMTFDEFYTALTEADKEYNLKHKGVLIHFRITTHGGTNKQNCHPFPVSNKDKKLGKHKVNCRYACVHNGVISLTSSEARMEGDHSDTWVFVRDYLSKIASNPGWFNNINNIRLVESLIDSKMAILSSTGDIIATRGFHKADDGNYYSNDSYKETKISYYGYGSSYGGWGDYYWDDDDYDYAYSRNTRKSTYTRLEYMMMKSGECAVFDDGTILPYDEEVPCLVSKNNEIYLIVDGKPVYSYIAEGRMTFLGKGCFISTRDPVDENGDRKPIDFRGDCYRYVGV